MNPKTLDILRTAIFNEAPTPGPVTAEVYEELKQQSVHILAAEALGRYEVEEQVLAKWEIDCARQMQQLRRYMENQKSLTEALRAEGIRPVILKGSSSAMYYPDPSLRMMGDVDLLPYPRNEETFEKAKKVYEELGFVVEIEGIRHIEYKKGRFVSELHSFFAGQDSEGQIELDRILDAAQPVRRTLQAGGIYEIGTLPDELNGLIFLEHVSHHVLSGLGLRQILDWMFYVLSVVDDRFWAETLKPLTDRTGLTTLAKIITRTCEVYFHMPEHTWCADTDMDACERLFQLVDKSGNFGRKKELVDKSTTAVLNNGIRLSQLQERGMHNWKAAQKHRILRPFAWLYQICRYFKKGILERGKGSKGLWNNYKEHKEQMKLFKKMRIHTYRK